MHWYGEAHGCRALVLSRLGPSVHALARHVGALPLAAGLAADVWATKPSFFGAQPTGTNYELSVNSVVVDFFVRRPSLPLAPPTPNPPPSAHPIHR